MDNLKGIDRLFPVIVGNIQLPELVEPVEELLSTLNYKDFVTNASVSMKILDERPELKKKFTEQARTFLNEVIEIPCDVQLCRSWFTRVFRNDETNPHTHKNSWWSACFYFQEDCGIILQTEPQGIWCPTDNHNLDNSIEVKYEPNVGTMLMFPSHVRHQIVKHEKQTTRESLAFNFMPLGEVGIHDSSFTYNIG